jgi:hypothetical protein
MYGQIIIFLPKNKGENKKCPLEFKRTPRH